ncbi:MAG: hypothetical protein HYY17_00725 [Planctomycetes bacterium]|nr:hypothetical protein [Planctomycetota bacterium]
MMKRMAIATAMTFGFLALTHAGERGGREVGTIVDGKFKAHKPKPLSAKARKLFYEQIPALLQALAEKEESEGLNDEERTAKQNGTQLIQLRDAFEVLDRALAGDETVAKDSGLQKRGGFTVKVAKVGENDQVTLNGKKVDAKYVIIVKGSHALVVCLRGEMVAAKDVLAKREAARKAMENLAAKLEG